MANSTFHLGTKSFREEERIFMHNLKRIAVAGTSAVTILVASALGVSATSVGADALKSIESDFASTLQAAGLTFSATAFETNIASGVHSIGQLFGRAISSLARTIPPGPEHGKLISSFARHNNPSNFNNPNSHGREGDKQRDSTTNPAVPTPTGHRP
jgi:hypothetical protein